MKCLYKSFVGNSCICIVVVFSFLFFVEIIVIVVNSESVQILSSVYFLSCFVKLLIGQACLPNQFVSLFISNIL